MCAVVMNKVPFKSITRRSTYGFTLIELLIVISIIGMLTAISIFGLQGARESSRDSKRKADLESIRSALEIYRADCGDYPSSISSGGQIKGDGSPSSCSLVNVYMEEVPADPDGSPYTYNRSAPTRYTLCATLEETASQYCVNSP